MSVILAIGSLLKEDRDILYVLKLFSSMLCYSHAPIEVLGYQPLLDDVLRLNRHLFSHDGTLSELNKY